MTKEDEELLAHYAKIFRAESHYSIGPSELEVCGDGISVVVRIPVFGLSTIKRDYQTGNHIPIKGSFATLGKKIQELRSAFKSLP